MIAMFKLFYNTIAACQRPVGPLLSNKCMYVCKTAILTDTPVKQQLEKQEAERKPSSSGGAHSVARRRKLTSQRRRVSKAKKLSFRDADDCCSSCGSVYGSASDKRIKEQWFKCSKCSRWAHESCGNIDNKLFQCLMCIDSDSN